MSDKVYVGTKAMSMKKGKEYEPISRVTMWYDDEHFYTAGDDSGRELECENPWATQQMVDNVYRQLKGFVYRPFEASGAVVDHAFELGDAVTIGGVYSFIGQAKQRFDVMGGADLSLPGEKEIDHEYPYESPQERELKRRVKLGQSYFGTRISRKEGLVIEKTDGESVSARAVFNAEELSFYDGAGERALYFDPVSGTYSFRGVLNVNDKFVVDKLGNVKLAGNINMSEGAIIWGGNGPVKYQFATSISGPWHDAMATNDKYRRDSLDGGTTWGEPYQFVGEDGKPGSDGSDANVTWSNVKKALSSAAALNASIITIDSVGAPNIYGGNIYGCNIYAGDGSSSFAQMTEAGFYLFRDDIATPKAQLAVGLDGTVSLILGAGSGDSTGIANRFYLTKDSTGTTLLYNDTNMNQCGFFFGRNGVITPIGELNVPARFS